MSVIQHGNHERLRTFMYTIIHSTLTQIVRTILNEYVATNSATLYENVSTHIADLYESARSRSSVSPVY